jgi:hemolysin activation/secretion protein
MVAFTASCVWAIGSVACAQETTAPATSRPVPTPNSNQPLSTLERLRVSEFRFEGNTAFPTSELVAVVSSFLNRDISSEELEEARRALTLHYVNRGFINSGALLKDQTVRDGIVVFTLVEGKLSQLELTGNRHYRKGFLEREIRRFSGAPFNVTKVRQRLEILRQNPNLSRINADVQPGTRPGEAILRVGIEENEPIGIGFQFDNQRPASIGAERVSLIAGTTNLTGRDDSLDLRLALTRGGFDEPRASGLRDFSLSYQSPPFLGRNAMLLNFGKSDSAVIEEPFKDLDISSRFQNYSIGFRHLQRKTLEEEIGFTLTLEHRRSLTFLAGDRFSFSRGDVNGEAKTTAIRLGEDFLKRNQNRVFAARGLLSINAGFPGSTSSPGNRDDHFVVALGQAQYVQVLNNAGRQLLLRASGQLASRPLLTVEQFSLGGADSVRGYRENQLVRDTGFSASAEMRFPVARAKSGQNILVLAPFADFGIGKNRSSAAPTESDTLSSIGIGAIYTPGRRLNAQLYYGYPLRKVDSPGNDLQDRGITFSVVFNLN